MRADLRRRVLEGLEAEIELFGGASEGAEVIRRPGIVASISPATPERSIFNSVFATGAGALTGAYDELAAAYDRAGVRAWLVWIEDVDRTSAEQLAERGHVLDGAPRSMALDLAELRRPEPAVDVELVPATMAEVARINDAAYGIVGDGWGSALTKFPSGLAMEARMALVGGEPASCAIVLDSGEDDACVSAVGTRPEYKGRGLAGAVICDLLDSALRRGRRTGSLQASKAGASVYERLGFVDVGCTELWELRKA